MGYTTKLYAVDIGSLRGAFGSNDQALLARVLAEAHDGESGAPRVDPTTGPRVLLTWKSGIFFNGQQVTREEFQKNLLSQEWAGTNLYLCQTDPPRGQKCEGEFKDPGSFMQFLGGLLKYSVSETGEVKKHIVGIVSCSTEDEFSEIGNPEDDLTEDQAAEEIIAGNITKRRNAPTYAYALENLCQTLGQFLGDVGTDQLRSLKLKTRLSKVRLPVKVPKNDDFPYVSFLEADEVQDEVTNLRPMDLSDPRDRENETERKRFLQYLEQAADRHFGVVGFYY
jgi:hypothetical protein